MVPCFNISFKGETCPGVPRMPLSAAVGGPGALAAVGSSGHSQWGWRGAPWDWQGTCCWGAPHSPGKAKPGVSELQKIPIHLLSSTESSPGCCEFSKSSLPSSLSWTLGFQTGSPDPGRLSPRDDVIIHGGAPVSTSHDSRAFWYYLQDSKMLLCL